MKKDKKRNIVIIMMLAIFILTGCKTYNTPKELSGALDKTIGNFKKRAGVELKEEINSVYVLEDTMQVITRKDRVSSIVLLENATDYTLFKVGVGMNKEQAQKTLEDQFGAGIKTLNSKKDSVIYSYYSGKNEIYMSVDLSTNQVSEMSFYKFDDIKDDDGEEYDNGNNGKLIALINDERVYYNEAMIYLKSVQDEYELEYGKGIWDSDIRGDGKTFEELIKEEVIRHITEIKIITKKATDLGITLTEDEIADAKSLAKDHYYDMTAPDIDSYLLTTEILWKVYKDNMLAKKVFETKTLNIDTNVSDDEARQIKVWHILINKINDGPGDGGLSDLEQEEEDALLEKVNQLYDKAKISEDFYVLAQSDSEVDEIEYVFGKGEAPIEYGDEFEQAAFDLKTGEISDLIETNLGWHIIYCVTDYDEDATIDKKESIISQRRDKEFSELFTKWSSEFEVILNVDTWNKISLKD